jgi:hypothetical protein
VVQMHKPYSPSISFAAPMNIALARKSQLPTIANVGTLLARQV